MWAIIAFAKLGFGDKAVEYYRMVNPIEHSRTKEAAKKYKVEPYVIAADIYGANNLVGRGGWTWYTGSSSWFCKAGLEDILGLKVELGMLKIEPCISSKWENYSIRYRYKTTIYNINVKNPEGKCTGENQKFYFNGKQIEEKQIKLEDNGKINEIKEILNEFKILPMDNFKIKIDIEENKSTFEGNAVKKAETISKFLNGKLCIADDSGIEIEYLNGFPGVHTKRWYKGTDRERNLEILEKLKDVPKERRRMCFTSAIAISNGTKTICEIGVIKGFVAREVRGMNGFGFDEIFELENGKTLAELSPEEKNSISARKIALEKLKKKLLENIQIIN